MRLLLVFNARTYFLNIFAGYDEVDEGGVAGVVDGTAIVSLTVGAGWAGGAGFVDRGGEWLRGEEGLLG